MSEEKLEYITISEVQKRANEFVESMMKAIKETNEKYAKETGSNTQPLVLGTCPNCNFDLSDFLSRRDFHKNFIKLIQKRMIITPDDYISEKE